MEVNATKFRLRTSTHRRQLVLGWPKADRDTLQSLENKQALSHLHSHCDISEGIKVSEYSYDEVFVKVQMSNGILT